MKQAGIPIIALVAVCSVAACTATTNNSVSPERNAAPATGVPSKLPSGLDGCEDQIGDVGMPVVSKGASATYLCHATNSTAGANPDATITRNGTKVSLATAFPNGKFDNTIGYATGFDQTAGSPYWVATHILGDYMSIPCYRTDPGACRADQFTTDPSGIGPTPDDYKGSKLDPKISGARGPYDRGHQSPAALYQMTSTTMKNSFYMTNMSPQVPGLNQGAWRVLEGLVKNWAVHRGELYVYTGPVGQDLTTEQKKASDYNPPLTPLTKSADCSNTPASTDCYQYYTIGSSNQVSVPTAFYKVVYAPKQQQAISFIMPNVIPPGCSSVGSKAGDPACDAFIKQSIRSVDEVEQATEIEFLTENVDESVETERSALWANSR